VATRWNRFYEKQMEDEGLRKLVERELENLELGVQIAKLREKEKLSQTKLAGCPGRHECSENLGHRE
jgi:hypothetical protein